MAVKEPLRVKLAGAQPQDFGKGIVRIAQAQIDRLWTASKTACERHWITLLSGHL